MVPFFQLTVQSTLRIEFSIAALDDWPDHAERAHRLVAGVHDVVAVLTRGLVGALFGLDQLVVLGQLDEVDRAHPVHVRVALIVEAPLVLDVGVDPTLGPVHELELDDLVLGEQRRPR